jgi:hypothetical protein
MLKKLLNFVKGVGTEKTATGAQNGNTGLFAAEKILVAEITYNIIQCLTQSK